MLPKSSVTIGYLASGLPVPFLPSAFAPHIPYTLSARVTRLLLCEEHRQSNSALVVFNYIHTAMHCEIVQTPDTITINFSLHSPISTCTNVLM